MTTHSSILPGESHGQRSLAGYSPWGRKASNMTERLTPFSEAAGVLGPDQGGARLTVASDEPCQTEEQRQVHPGVKTQAA